MSFRKQELQNVVDNLSAYHAEWAQDDNRSNPDAGYWDAVTEVLDAFESGEVPADCRELALAVESFRDEMTKFDEREDQRGQYPHDSFWATRQAVEDVRYREQYQPELMPLEPIAELMKLPGMSENQVAQMYGFINSRGVPMPHLVRKEMATPGSVLNTPGSVDGRDWCDPRVEQQNKSRKVQLKAAAKAMLDKREKSKVAEAPCPESPRELWEQGVAPQQSAAMLKISVGEVARLYRAFEAEKLYDGGRDVEQVARTLNMPAAEAESLYRAWANDQQPEAALEAESDGVSASTGTQEDAASSIDQAIRELAADGHEAADIAKEVGKSKRYVEGVLKATAAV